MRHEGYCVACGIGPTSLRLQRYEQKVLESQSCGAIPSKPKTRGVRTLHDMFRLMTQLVTKNPSRELSTCDTSTPFSPSIPYEAVAVDGICEGYPTKFVKPFISVSVACKPVGPTTSDPTTSRPKCRLLKRSDTMKFLLQAARGEKIRVTSRTVRPIMAAFHLLAPFVFPADWSLESICGLSETDFGIEDQIESILGIVAKTTSLLFNGNVRVDRLAKPLHTYFQIHLSALKTALGAAAAGQREEISKKRANGVLNRVLLKGEAVVQKIPNLAEARAMKM